ncbi:MAG: hypothetical protein L0J63_08060 [Tetragenococcus koreensis]|nr:hypothetical protein [Tetragenococcus koreensis]
MEKTIYVDKTVQEEVLLTQEEISKYEVDKRGKNITVEVRLTGENTNRVETETYRFFSSDFINEPTETDLWQLIDKKRSDG